MEIIAKRVEYYCSTDALDGIDLNNPDQYATREGKLITLANTVKYIDGVPFGVTEAIVEDIDTREINFIDYHRLKRFVE